MDRCACLEFTVILFEFKGFLLEFDLLRARDWACWAMGSRCCAPPIRRFVAHIYTKAFPSFLPSVHHHQMHMRSIARRRETRALPPLKLIVMSRAARALSHLHPYFKCLLTSARVVRLWRLYPLSLSLSLMRGGTPHVFWWISLKFGLWLCLCLRRLHFRFVW